MRIKSLVLSLCIIFSVPLLVFATVFERDLYFGMSKDPDVGGLQEFLRDQGLYQGPVTGNFLSLTRSAVRSFQERENITPALGYFGQKTRARAKQLLIGKPFSRQQEIASLHEQIVLLEKQLSVLLALQKKELEPVAPLPISTSSVLPPVESVPSLSPEPVAITPAPTPSLIATPPAMLPILIVKGENTQSFPDTAVSPFKVGNFSVANGTSTDVLFSQIELDIYDAMNSSLNRGKKVLFKIHNGTTTFDELISQTEFTLNEEAPPINSSHRRQIKLPFPVNAKTRETITTSLWIEGLDYVISGSLRLESLKIYTTSLAPEGGFHFVLTR